LIQVFQTGGKSFFETHLNDGFQVFQRLETEIHTYPRTLPGGFKSGLPFDSGFGVVDYTIFITKGVNACVILHRLNGFIVKFTPMNISLRTLHIVEPISPHFKIEAFGETLIRLGCPPLI
jgi:hypothetical protein